MRIIGTINHPTLKISVFRNDNRLTVKLENEHYEINHKLGDDDRFRSVEDVERLLDAEFLAATEAQIRALHQARLGALARQFAPEAGEEFDTII